MNSLISLDAAFAIGISLSCTLSGLALAHSLHSKRATVAKARRVAASTVKNQVGHWFSSIERDVRRLERDELTINRTLNVHGLMRGRLIVPAKDDDGSIRLRASENFDSDAA